MYIACVPEVPPNVGRRSFEHSDGKGRARWTGAFHLACSEVPHELCSVHILEHAHFHPAWKQVRVAADWGKAPRTEIANGKWPETTLGWLNYARWESLENLKSQPFQAVLDVLTAKLGTSGAA